MLHPQTIEPQKLVCPVCWLVFEAAMASACKSCGTAAPAAGWPSLPFVFRGRYQVVAQLGRGGMGAVFKAYDAQSPQQPWVALEVVQLKGDLAARRALEDAFRREGSAAAMLSEHPKVHRDLKPDNIFACRTDTGFQAKIADLGVWIDSGEAADTSLFGTGELHNKVAPADDQHCCPQEGNECRFPSKIPGRTTAG